MQDLNIQSRALREMVSEGQESGLLQRRMSLFNDSKESRYDIESSCKTDVAGAAAALPKRTYSPIYLFTHSLHKKAAFTLAEVLITLGVIGIVAALTIPGMIANHQKRVTAESVKKAYAILTQVQAMAENDRGMASDWGYRKVDELDKWVQTYFEPYVKVISSGKCSGGKSCYGISYMYRMGYNVASNSANARAPHYMVVTGGVPVAYSFFRYSGELYEPVTRIRVYLRNPKRYAFVGKDVFTFTFDNREKNPHFLPYASNYSREQILAPHEMNGSCNLKTGEGGYWMAGDACAALIMKDGWQITDDYPW